MARFEAAAAAAATAAALVVAVPAAAEAAAAAGGGRGRSGSGGGRDGGGGRSGGHATAAPPVADSALSPARRGVDTIGAVAKGPLPLLLTLPRPPSPHCHPCTTPSWCASTRRRGGRCKTRCKAPLASWPATTGARASDNCRRCRHSPCALPAQRAGGAVGGPPRRVDRPGVAPCSSFPSCRLPRGERRGHGGVGRGPDG